MNNQKQLNEALEHFKKNLTSGDPLLGAALQKIEKCPADAGLSLGDNVRKALERLTPEERAALQHGLMKFSLITPPHLNKDSTFPQELGTGMPDLNGAGLEKARKAAELKKPVIAKLSEFHPKKIDDKDK